MTKRSKLVNSLPSYAVGAIARRKRELIADGVDVIDIGVGDVDLAPPQVAIEALDRAVRNPINSRYPFQIGSPAYREEISAFMKRRFGVDADAKRDILPLIGSKEGLAHLPAAVADPGDICVVPEPGYPPYVGGSMMAGMQMEVVHLKAENGFLVDLEALGEEKLARTRVVYLNYPNNPTGAVASEEYLKSTVEICRKYDIVLAFDNPYSEITYDGYVAPSILNIDGAWDVAVEFHSLSKSFAMTGWRLAWVVGNSEVIEALSTVKGYVDTGQFLAVQEAGAAVLKRAEELIEPVRETFRVRREALVGALLAQQVECEAPLATMYLWVPLPEGIKSTALAHDLLENEGLAVIAGSALGEGGEGFIRMSFVVEPERLEEAAVRFRRGLNRLASA